MKLLYSTLCLLFVLAGLCSGTASGESENPDGGSPSTTDFEREVPSHLTVPLDEQSAYARRLADALDAAGTLAGAEQFILLVDRSAQVQAALLYRGSIAAGWRFVGATLVSTGLPGRYEHFVTPLGVFDHTLTNPDFRAEGTKNKLGFRGYGRKGMRVYDFGWVDSPRGWGDGAGGRLRFQMHATDPVLAEPFLGAPRSEGCVRIPGALNTFIDRHALLDADYLKGSEEGTRLWILRPDRVATSVPGRYLVVVDSNRSERPAWAALPVRRRGVEDQAAHRTKATSSKRN
ncbi:MAG: L,D-transpeptidase [Burkholderiaceae bacterium]